MHQIPHRYRELTEKIAEDHVSVCSSQRELLATIAEAGSFARWEDDGCRDLAHWVSTRLGITVAQASRWVRAAKALRLLPTSMPPSAPASCASTRCSSSLASRPGHRRCSGALGEAVFGDGDPQPRR